MGKFLTASCHRPSAAPMKSNIIFSDRVEDANDRSAFDEQSFSVIKLNNGTALYLREVNKFLALVCILREENFNEKQGVIDYNFQCFRQAIKEVFELKNVRFIPSYESQQLS